MSFFTFLIGIGIGIIAASLFPEPCAALLNWIKGLFGKKG